MKKIVFLTLTLLSLINVEAFASQPQSTRTSSWLSWAPYAAAVGFAGTIAGGYFYGKYSGRYERQYRRYLSQKWDEQILDQLGEVAYYTREASTLENIRHEAEGMKNPLDRNARLGSLETQINLLPDSTHKNHLRPYPKYLEKHIKECPYVCANGKRCDILNANVNAVNTLLRIPLAQNQDAKAEADLALAYLQKEQKKKYNDVQSLKTKKNIARAASIASGGSFVGLTAFSIYNWLKR